jgi:hypothetical protein
LLVFLVPVERIELPTFGLQNRCTTAVLHRRAARSLAAASGRFKQGGNTS